MDNQRFDDLTRALANGVSRRRLLAGLLGAAAGVLSVGAATESATAASRCRGDGHRCGDGSDCCSGFCLDYDPVTRHRKVCATCGTGTIPCNNSCVPVCPNGQTMGEDCACGCAEGQVACGDGCFPACPPGVDLADDCTCPCAEGTSRCGTECVPNCPEGQVFNETCGCVCSPGTVACGDQCVASCADGQQLDAECECICAPSTVACGNTCVPACPTGQSLDGSCVCVCDQSGEPPCGNICCQAGATCLEGQCQPEGSGTCSAASRCGERHYCNEEQTCICVETPDGDLRCGRVPTTCDVQLCESNADCANLGEGYFCDTPYSGCCSDPPAEFSRCLAPCEAPVCPAERDCGDVCCPVGQICAAGACAVPCETTTDCDNTNDCIEQTCDPVTGTCRAQNVANGTACNGNTGTCSDGACISNNACDGSGCFGQRCGSDQEYCLCTGSVEGTGFCLDAFKADCALYTPCSASSECDDGLCLATADCCGGQNLCVPASAACPA